MGRGVAGRGAGASGGSGGVGFVALRPWVAPADRGAFSAGGVGVGSGGVERWSPDDRDGELHSFDGAQDALSVGVSDACGGGVGLDSLAAVLPDLAERAGAGRVDGPQADQAAGLRDGERADARVDRQGDAREALSSSGGEDRLDRDRGRREVSDRLGAGCAGCAGARPGGEEARGARRRAETAGARSLAVDGTHAARDHAHDPPSQRGGQGRGSEADREDRRAARIDRSPRPGGWRPAHADGRAVVARRSSSRRPRSSSSWPTAARRSPSRSNGASRASRSQTG